MALEPLETTTPSARWNKSNSNQKIQWLIITKKGFLMLSNQLVYKNPSCTSRQIDLVDLENFTGDGSLNIFTDLIVFFFRGTMWKLKVWKWLGKDIRVKASRSFTRDMFLSINKYWALKSITASAICLCDTAALWNKWMMIWTSVIP